MSDNSKTITFYDIALKPPVQEHACSPNPTKARMALNFKRLPYSTTWVPLPEVSSVRRDLNVPPCRKFADGSDYYTLPIIDDQHTNTKVGDSFDIAVYLQKTYPDAGEGDLFPPQTLDFEYKAGAVIAVPLSDLQNEEFPEYAKFNQHVDAVFTMHTGLAIQCFPFDPATAEQCKAEFARRAGVSSMDQLNVVGEAREKTKDSLRDALRDLAVLFERDNSGPFILGQKATYADLIVGGWLRFMNGVLPKSEWEELRGWHGGVFARLFDALEAYREMK
ncbi:hypothetical protein N7539_008985 [Penicillium diatomitis]|uniref:GST N-terminal domain-containing protein n=1 Tax=Penicillium diatomitis TaxID=2819901 RepID=A0A9W9WLG9_9EURO|nr:uncharacterized protein N7539_008985 [Penicillium diatomitis]KAJ5469367.1 hypothetical protein N7539_008985 [Penicillium diatomitis]